MKHGSFKISCWLAVAIAGVALALPGVARAATNVVPNPGFEQGGCGSTPVICGWETGSDPNAYMSQDTANPHSGSASLLLGWSGETDGSFLRWWGAEASTDAAFCAAIGPGAHPASLWYANVQSVYGDGWVSLGASFYQGADCSGATSRASLSQVPSGPGWQQLTGTLVAPPGTQSARFSVGVLGSCDNYSGCWVSANFDDLDVEDAVVTTPAISSFTPGSGPVGTSVDIHGVNFSGATSVTFNGTAASFTVDSDAEIHATVPSGATTGPISVTAPNGTGTSNSSFGVTPTISSFTPTCGPAGAIIDILGMSFTGATSVMFNGTGASFTVDSDSEIHATVPSGWTLGPISVTTQGGTGTSSSSFMGPCQAPAPTIGSFTPTSGPVGTSVAITGTDFTGATSVTFSGTSASFAVDSSTSITATLPGGATTGPISVTTPSGTAISASSFTVVPDIPPLARFTFSCTALACSFDGGASSDPDGTIQTYSWDFGDSASGSGKTTDHGFAQGGSYTVTLRVTDNDGATAGTSQTVIVISLTARGYKLKGLEKADLSWTGPSGARFDVYRNGARVATVQATTYTDNINNKGPDTYTYKVCGSAFPSCSNQVSVSF